MKAAKALKEKGETPEELLQSIKENEKAVAEAQRVVDAWKAIVGEMSRREEAAKAEAERIAAEKAEEARVEAERKAEEERIAKQKAEEKTAEAESDKEEAEKRMDDEEPKPLGSGVFGNIYNQFKGKVKEAFDFLMKHKGGDLLGVFHRKDVGDIDLVWGDHGGGLAHIIRRHIIEQNDFKNVDEIQKVIEDVIRNGLIVRENKDKINIEYNGYRVSIKKTIRDSKGNVVENKNWIVTAFDKSKPKHEKRNPSSSETLTTPSANQKADGVTLPSNEDSIDKGSKKAEKKQKKQSVFDKAKEIADKEEKKRKAEAEDDSALGQATRAVGKKKKVNLFKYTASKIISYPALRGVHYANGYAYASDGYILFKEKADYPKEWEGTTRDKDGNLIDGKYPDTEKAIHRLVHIPDKEAVSLPSKEVLDFAIAASKKLKGEAIPVAIDGLFFNAVNLKKFLEAVASKGMDKIVYRHPMLYATNGKDEIVMMPTVNTLEGALDIADKMESAGLPKEQIDAWKAHIEAADKKMSLEDFKKAVENAKKEGVRHTEAEKPKEQPLTEAERKDAEEVAGALGYRVEWVDTMEENGTIDADKKVIRIAKDAENPLVQVLGHEVAHGVRRMIGGKFRTLQKAALEVVGEKEWDERIEKKRKLNAYAEGKLAEEVTCDIVGEALNNKDALKRLAESLRGEKGILARLRDAVAKMVEYFKNRGDKEGVRRMKAADKLLAEFESALKEDVASGQANTEGVDRSVRESEDEPENKRRKDFAERFGVDESYVSDYANGMAQKNTGKAAIARRSMERQIYLANDGKTSKLSDIAKSLKSFRAALKEAFGDLDALIDEYRKLFEEERNMMEAARKKAEEEAAARKRHLDELSLLTDGQIDSRYAEALEKGDETEAREMLDEVARRKGYGDENNEYRMQHRAPSNPGYESDEARRNDIENGPDVNLEDIALGYNRQPDDYFTNPRGYGNDTPHGRESTDAVANALSSIRQGGRDVTVKVYRAVPTTMKEGKLRNGDWVTLSRRYAEMHGNHTLNGKYRIMEDEVPAKDIWWDGNDVNEFGYDNGEDYKYKNVKNNRKSDDLVTRDDKGNVIPPSKRFNQRKADERYSRRESKALTAEERELRDNLVERMRKGGLDVVTDSEEMQRVIDTENERTRMMGAGSVREHRVYHGSGADFDAFDHSHMGEGEGAQAYGWGTYVTEVEGIGRTYAIQNTTKHNDALRALQHDVDAISDQLNRQRDDLKYDEEQLKRANEWRAEAELDYELFKDEAEKLKEKYGEASPKYRNHLFNDIYTDEMKRAQSSVKSTEESIQYRKEKISELEKALKDKQAEIDELPKEFPRHLYTVEIPDDNGSNYLDWNGHPAESLLKDVGSFLESEGFERVQDSPVRYEKSESTVVLNPNATGADLYAELREALGSDKKASQALAELGCIGIKYPADNMRGGREDGAKNYVIFNENDAKITDHTRFLRTAGGEVYGLVKDGRIYLDPKVATSETAVHEYTHLWGDMLRRKDSEQWSHTVKELKNSVLWEEVKESYPELKTDDEIADEVLSTFSGRRGAERLREEARRVADGEGGVFTKAKAIETLERVKEAIARFWEGVARMFGINRYRSAEELADMAMRDLINGVKPTSRTFTFDNFYKDTKAVFEGTERPKGKPDYTSYSGSEYWYGEDKGGKYVVRGSDHWSGEFKVKDGERTNVGRNHYSEITEDGMLPIGAQGSLKFGWEKGLSKPVGSGISAAIDRRGSGDSNNIASCYWYIDNAKEKDNKGFTYGKAYLSEFEDKERRRDIPGDDWRDIQGLEGGTRNMFVGERGATEADKAEEVSTRLDNLSVARRMEEAKKDAKTIKMATGWERGSDGKWRYETGDAKIKDTIELDDKTFKRYDEDMLWTSGKFGDVVDAPELFKAYPELRDVRIETDAVLNDMPSNGEYNPRTNTITIHSDDLKYQNSILNHEIQHAIQHIEGFETGGSAENVRERIQQVIDNSSDEVGYARERLREWADLNAMAAMLDVAYRKFVGSGNEWERAKAVEIYWDAINTIEDNDKAELAINYPHDKTPREVAESGYLVDDVIRELNRLADETRKEIPDGDIDTMRKVDRLVGALKDKTDFELYNRLAGEVEARNTEKRIGMTEEERRANLASETEDVAREDQILLRQGLDGIDIMRSEAAATPLKGDEALTALDSIFGENEGSAIPPKISSFAKFKNLFKKPVRTFLGELVQVKDEVWNKILRNNRQDITGTVLPTIESADFAIRDTDGSTLYVKRFKGDGQERMYNVVVVNKHGEVEDYISSVHIKRDNNLRNKIKKGAELFLPNARTTDGTMSRNNSTPGAKVANYSETAKPRYSRKPGESIFDYASRVSEDVDRSVRERVSARDEYEKKVKSKGFQTKEALQNSMLGLQEFMSAIDHASGNRRYIEDIPDIDNPILGENRLSSVNKEEMHQVAKTQFKPLMSAVAKLSGNGKESGELYDYMFAKHGLERDAVMRQREAQKEFDKYQKANPKGTKTIGDFVASLEGKDYAGLTALTAEDGRVKSIQSQIDAIDEQMKATDDQLLLRKLGGQKKRLKVDLLNAARDAADDIRKTFENNPSHDRSDINELWSRVNEVNGNTLRKLYESGMLTKEAYNDISSMYTNYIPMRGFDQTTSADAYAYLTHGDSAEPRNT